MLFRQMPVQVVQNTVEIAQNLVVPVAHNAVAMRGEIGIAGGVGVAGRVLAAVDLDDDFRVVAEEIHHIGAKNSLAAEGCIGKAMGAQS